MGRGPLRVQAVFKSAPAFAFFWVLSCLFCACAQAPRSRMCGRLGPATASATCMLSLWSTWDRELTKHPLPQLFHLIGAPCKIACPRVHCFSITGPQPQASGPTETVSVIHSALKGFSALALLTSRTDNSLL